MVKFSTEQKWYYYPEMTKDEVGFINHLKLVGGDWNMNFMTSHILGMSSSQLDELIFFREVAQQVVGLLQRTTGFLALISRARWCSPQWCLLV